MSARKVLVMDFLDHGKTTRSLRLTDPKEDLTSAQVQAAMERIAELRALYFFHNFPATLKGAKTVSTVTTKFEITAE